MNRTEYTIRVVVADDSPVARAGIRTILEKEPDIKIVGEAEDAWQTEQMVAELRPDILLLDLIMPGLRPYEIEKWVRTNYPETTTLVLTAHDRDCYLTKTIEAGIMGYLTKDEAPYRLVQAVRRAAYGEVLITKKQLVRATLWRDEVGKRWDSLTERECQVFRLLMRGLNNKAIAEALCVTTRTVEYHVASILRKVGVSSRQEVVVWGLTHLPDNL
jgi:DNA-binding NarL/FixJ family response regulator